MEDRNEFCSHFLSAFQLSSGQGVDIQRQACLAPSMPEGVVTQDPTSFIAACIRAAGCKRGWVVFSWMPLQPFQVRVFQQCQLVLVLPLRSKDHRCLQVQLVLASCRRWLGGVRCRFERLHQNPSRTGNHVNLRETAQPSKQA